MKKLLLLAFMASIMAAPVTAVAEEKKRDDSAARVFGDAMTIAGETIVETIIGHPGKSAGVATCGIMAGFFPPVLVPCNAAIVAGTGTDVAKYQKE